MEADLVELNLSSSTHVTVLWKPYFTFKSYVFRFGVMWRLSPFILKMLQ